MKRVTYEEWDLFARKIVKKNMSKYGRSLTFISIQRKADRCIIEVEVDNKVLLVVDDWKDKMQQIGLEE